MPWMPRFSICKKEQYEKKHKEAFEKEKNIELAIKNFVTSIKQTEHIHK